MRCLELANNFEVKDIKQLIHTAQALYEFCYYYTSPREKEPTPVFSKV